MAVRTRFAPSPTGKPHVGNIRTAIFAFLAAKSKNGEFIVRIEDTDKERFVEGAIEYMEESLKWLDIDWDDEKKVHQSDRLDIYQKYADKLIAEDKVYKCFCSKERLIELKEKQSKEGKPPGYDSCCRVLTKEDIEKKEKAGEKPVIRFKIPKTPKEIVWNDTVRGEISIRTDIQEDFVIMKSDSYPTYNFANVIDDHDMEITDVIRGEEFIPSTPKHILIYMALGWTPPKFSHLPLIIGKDKKKLGKRHGDTAILDYRDNGYLADTMLNFLTLLGWNDGTTQELFTRDELIKKFDLKRVGKSPAIFDLERLDWINGEKIREMDIANLMKEIKNFSPDFLKGKEGKLLERALTVMQTRMVTLKDFTENADYFFEDIDYSAKILVFGKSTKEASMNGLRGVLKVLEATKTIDTSDSASDIMKAVVEAEKLTNGDVFWPVRVALSGEEKSPSPNEIMWALGKDESIKRVRSAITKMEKL